MGAGLKVREEKILQAERVYGTMKARGTGRHFVGLGGSVLTKKRGTCVSSGGSHSPEV